MEVGGYLHAPVALPSGKEPLVPIGQEAGRTLEPAWTLWNTEKSFVPEGVQPIARRYTYWAIPVLKNKYIYKVITFKGL
jgi:hypothetical protein